MKERQWLRRFHLMVLFQKEDVTLNLLLIPVVAVSNRLCWDRSVRGLCDYGLLSVDNYKKYTAYISRKKSHHCRVGGIFSLQLSKPFLPA